MDNDKKFWLIAVSMGYGHQRTAFPLRDFAEGGKIINANNYQGIPERDRKIWENTRRFYEFISNFKKIPLVGNFAFSVFDKFQQIPVFYPYRDLSQPTIALKRIFSLIKKGWGKDLILRLKENPLPLVTTFFIPAFMAEVNNYLGEIHCVICDADISRAWAPLEPQKSIIKYFVPNSRVQDRLRLYGIKKENIFLTGYPLPKENISQDPETGKNLEIVKNDLRFRLLNLDPQKRYYKNFYPLIEKYLGFLPEKPDHILTIMFSIGGAGAQKEIAIKFVKNLSRKIKSGEIKIILMAGTKEKVKNYFEEKIKNFGLEKGTEIIYAENIEEYFEKFNQKLRKTDILWTKPSELSFYSGLGLPLILASSIGSQEDFNRKWLLETGSAVLQENPNYSRQWLFDHLESGIFAEAAMEGFIEVEKLGTYNIKKICGD